MKFVKKLHSVLETDSVRTALIKINKSGIRGVIVINKKNKLIGTLSDGDIRKKIVKRADFFKEKIQNIINKRPVIIKEGDNLKKIKSIFLSNKINFAPLISKNFIVKKILRWEEIFDEKYQETQDTPVVLMAGGEGTRLQPFTNVLPKPLMPIAGKPMMEHILINFSNQNYKKFIVSLNYKSELIKAYFKSKKYLIKFIKENRKLGTAGSLSLMKNEIKSDFFLVNCDVLFNLNLSDITNFHYKNKSDLTIVAAHDDYKIPYGVCEITNNGKLKSLKEKPNISLLINTGLYYLNKKVLSLIPRKKYDLNELIKSAQKKRLKVLTYIISSKSWIDVGQKEDYLKSYKNIKF